MTWVFRLMRYKLPSLSFTSLPRLSQLWPFTLDLLQALPAHSSLGVFLPVHHPHACRSPPSSTQNKAEVAWDHAGAGLKTGKLHPLCTFSSLHAHTH